MPASAASVLLGRNQSRANAITVSTGVTSFDTVTIVHGLGRTPDKCRAILRCIRAALSASAEMVFLSANASQALFLAPVASGVVNADWDFDCEVVHTSVR